MTTFLIGFLDLRTRSFLDEYPRILARLITDLADGERLHRDLVDEERARRALTLRACSVLFAINLAVLVIAIRSANATNPPDDQLLDQILPLAIIAGHVIVLVFGFLDQRWTKKRMQRAFDASVVRAWFDVPKFAPGESDATAALIATQRTIEGYEQSY